MVVWRKLEPTQQRELRFMIAGRDRLVCSRGRSLGHQPIGGKGLELYGIGTGLVRDIDQCEGLFPRSVVVDASFGDNEDAFGHAGISVQRNVFLSSAAGFPISLRTATIRGDEWPSP